MILHKSLINRSSFGENDIVSALAISLAFSIHDVKNTLSDSSIFVETALSTIFLRKSVLLIKYSNAPESM